MRLALMLLCSTLLGGATVERVTPPEGGVVYWHNADVSFAAGHSWLTSDGTSRAWLWTHDSGTVWLDRIGGPKDASLRHVVDTGDEWLLLLSVFPVGEMTRHEYLMRLPHDVASIHCAADFDYDGDVDQSDFGHWQRDPSAMPLERFLGYMTGAGQ